MSWTYVIVDTDSYREYEGWLVKIGKSRNPRGRMAGFQTANPGTLILAATIPGAEWESLLHRMLSHDRVRGEWFRLDLSRIFLLASIASEHDYEYCDHDRLDGLVSIRGAHNHDEKCLAWSRAWDVGFDDGEAMARYEAGGRAKLRAVGA